MSNKYFKPQHAKRVKFANENTIYYCERHEEEFNERKKRMNRSRFQKFISFFKDCEWGF